MILRACVWDCPDGQKGSMDGIRSHQKPEYQSLVGRNQETLHFQVALIQGYHINLTLLSEWPHGRKWVEGRDLECTSQTSSASTQGVEGVVCAEADSACQMAWKSELLGVSEDHIHIQAIRFGATVTEWPHTPLLFSQRIWEKRLADADVMSVKASNFSFTWCCYVTHHNVDTINRVYCCVTTALKYHHSNKGNK